MLGVGTAAVVIAVAVIVVVALNLTGGSETSTPAIAQEFPPYTHIIGDRDAPVTVVEFGDFQ